MQSNLATSARAATCSDKRNPHVNHRKYKNGQYGALAKEEQYRVNVEHKLTEEQAVVLPLRRKLARHFAQHASDNAMSKLKTLIDQTKTGDFDVTAIQKKIAEEDAMDAQKKNQMSGVDKMKNKLKEKEEKKKREEAEKQEEKKK